MKINELMIGDWYYDVSMCEDKEDPKDKHREAHQVGSIEHFQYDEDSKSVFRVNANFRHPRNWVPCSERNIRPVPISDDILTTNGFSRKYNTFSKRIGNILVTVISDDTIYTIYIQRAHVVHTYAHYVHELQHFLTMGGLNDFALNFKI